MRTPSDLDSGTRVPPRADLPSTTRSGIRADLVAGGLALLFVAIAVTVGIFGGGRLAGPASFPGAPELFGEWPVLGEIKPHLGPGTPFAVLLAVAAVAWGPDLARRLRWRPLLAAGYLFCVMWTFALAMVDGWREGVAGRLATPDEYLPTVREITDIPAMLRGFTGRILDYQPDSWPTHVSAHPPGATLVFVWLDRIGLGGGGWAAVLCVLVGAAVAVAVPVTIAVLGRVDHARAALPFVALMPGAVWFGVAADGMFAGVVAVGIALFAVGAAQARTVPALLGGVLLGFGVFLSYGLVLMSSVAMAVVVVTRRWRALLPGVAGALAVTAAFALSGFWWFDGYQLVVQRYHQSLAEARPGWYWIWANLACLVLVVGPAVVAGLRRAVPRFVRPGGDVALIALVRGGALAVVAADVSGLSKAEVERIWLAFAVWLVAAAALLPAATRRWWLVAQALTALTVNHVLLTNW